MVRGPLCVAASLRIIFNQGKVWLMNSTGSGNNAIQYRDHAFSYDSETLLELESEFVRETAGGKQYRQKRSSTQKRRKAPKASHPGCGMSARRNHQWNW
jgi:hypothetical protein